MASSNGNLGSKRETERARFWRKQIAAWERSGLTQAEFCRREGLSAAAFSWWKAEWGRRVAVQVKSGSTASKLKKSAPTSFSPVRILEASRFGGPEGGIEIVHPSGWRVVAPEGVSEETLRRVLRAVRSC